MCNQQLYSSYLYNVWNFGDGSISTTDWVTVNHTYTAPGIYHVVLTANGINIDDTSGVTITL